MKVSLHPHMFALGVALVLLSACSGGGASAGPGDTQNLGTYSLGDFGYVDTHPAGFHPLGTVQSTLLARDEVFGIYPNGPGAGGRYELQEGPDEAHAPVVELAGLLGSRVDSAVALELDGDAESELLVATILGGGTSVQIQRVDRMPNGSYQVSPLRTIAAQSWNFADVRLSAGDLDRDYRDEWMVVVRSAPFHQSATHGELWAFDDPEQGGGELLNYVRSASHVNLWALPIDVDGDHRKELVVALGGDTTDSGRLAIQLYALPEGALAMDMVHGYQYLEQSNAYDHSRVRVGDFDGDGREDLAWIGYKKTTLGTMTVKLFEARQNSPWFQYGSIDNITVSPLSLLRPDAWDAVAVHPNLKQANLTLAFTDTTGMDLITLHFQRNLGNFSSSQVPVARYTGSQGVRLTATDLDADGEEEVQVALWKRTATQGVLDLGYLEFGSDGGLVWQATRAQSVTGPNPGQPTAPTLVCGDFDADGTVLEFTGRREPHLGDPVPIVLLAAPPTVPGISQNYNDTESSYETGTSLGTSFGVSSNTAIRKEVVSGLDLDVFFSYELRAAMETAIQRTNTNTRTTSTVQGYRGGFSSDVLIFQGTLYESYEYRILAAADPSAIGTLIMLDVPIDANTYKWTVDYYNSQVAPEDRIDPSLRQHVAGQAATYPTRQELLAEMSGDMHWDLPGARPVGQGDASDYQAVEFAVENVTEEQRTVTKAAGAGAKVLGIGGNLDAEFADGATHAIHYGSHTKFEATVGDISDPMEYEAWRYNWGFSVHTVGRHADGSNQPAGYSNAKHSFQYLRYWVEPTGTAF